MNLHQWRERVILTMLHRKTVKIFSARLGDNQWQLIAEHAINENKFLDVIGVRPKSFLLDDVLVTSVPGRELSVLDLRTNNAELRKMPGSIQMFSASADGALRCRCATTLKVDPYESHDLGKTWIESTSSRFMLMPVFRDKLNGVGFKMGIMSSNRFAYTSDGSKSWVDSQETSLFFDDFFYSSDGRQVYARTQFGDIWQSSDDGRNSSAHPKKIHGHAPFLKSSPNKVSKHVVNSHVFDHRKLRRQAIRSDCRRTPFMTPG